MTIDDLILAHLKSAEAQLEAERVGALLRLETALRSAGLDEAEIAARVDSYADELLDWRDDAVLRIAGRVNERNLQRQGSTVGVEQQSGMRH